MNRNQNRSKKRKVEQLIDAMVGFRVFDRDDTEGNPETRYIFKSNYKEINNIRQ